MFRSIVVIGVAATVPAMSRAQPPAADVVGTQNAAVVARYYPAASLKRGEEGVVGFRVALERNGRIRSCSVTRTSGYAALDTAACDVMIDTAQFPPAAKGDGRSWGSFDGQIVWRLPAGTIRPVVAPPRTVTIQSDEIVCRRQARPGSLYIVRKICLSPADWQRTYEYGRMQTRLYQGGDFTP